MRTDFSLLRLFCITTVVLLFIPVLVLPVTAISQTPSPLDESHLYDSAKSAFDQGLFEVAQARTKELIRRFPTTSRKSESLLIQAQSLYYLGQATQALTLLNQPTATVPVKVRATYVFWQGEILCAAEKWAEAEKKYRELLALLPPAQMVQSGQFGLAWTLYKQNKESEAVALLQTLQSQKTAPLASQKAGIILARISLSKGQNKESATQLESLLASDPQPEIFFTAHYWLGEIAQADHKWAEALQHYGMITSNSKAFPRTLVAQSWFGVGASQHALGIEDKAMQALESAYMLADDGPLKLASFRLYLQSAQSLQRLPEALAKLREFAQKNDSPVTSSSALFAIGSAQATLNQPDEAIGTLEAMLTAYPTTPWKTSATYLLGGLYQDKNQKEAALKAFQSTLDSGVEPEMQHQVEFKMGELYFSEGDWSKALSFFKNASVVGGPTGEKALFNLALVQAQRDDLEAFNAAEAALRKLSPQSLLLGRIMMEKARLLERKGYLDQAKAVYQDILTQNPDPAQRPLFLLRLGDLYFNSGQMPEALKLYEELVTSFPQDSRVPEAAYKAIWCNYQNKELGVEQTRNALLELLRKYPQNPQAARILFNAAEFFFNAQDYVSAQTRFVQVATDYPQSELLDEAWFFAGRAAIERKDYGQALELLEKVRDKSPFKVDARILQGLTYHLQLRFENAVTLFDSVLTTEKSGTNFVEASLRKGDCLFALGSNDPARYEQAAASFGSILSTTQGNDAQRNEAAFKRGKCFEKINRFSDALALYLDILNGKPVEEAAAPLGSTQELPPEMFWRVQAGLGAAELRQKDKDWRGALAVYRKLEQLGGPLQQEFRSTINQLRREHFLYGEEGS